MKKNQTKPEIRPPVSDETTGNLRVLLEEIEREEVPERLLERARQLQGELAVHRHRGRRSN